MNSLHVYGEDIPTTIVPMIGEELTFYTAEYAGRTFRFSVRGPQDGQLEVCYLHEFDMGPAGTREAWFPIDEANAAAPTVLQEYLYDQLALLHRRVLREAQAPLEAVRTA